jgi:hypothetical protein
MSGTRRVAVAGQRVDRRVRRTRELLRGSLLSLIAEKGYERVTVQDVIDRAGVGRSTFYAHFRDRRTCCSVGSRTSETSFETRSRPRRRPRVPARRPGRRSR